MFGGGGSLRSGMQFPTGAEAKQRFAGTHSQAEIGNDNGRQRRQDESEAKRRFAGRIPKRRLGTTGDDRGNLPRQRGGTPMGTHDRMSGGIPDVFIPPTMIDNAGVRGGRNENSGMTTGDAPGSESQGDVWRGWIVPVRDAIHDRRRGEAELRGDAFPSRDWERQRTTETTG